jgi:NitT/TauT family transport system permease protein
MSANKQYWLGILALQITSIGVFLLGWQILVSTRILNPYLFASPVQIVQDFAHVVERHQVYTQIGNGMVETMFAFSVAMVIGIVAGLLIGSVPFARNVLEPFLVLFNAIPKIIFLPIFYLSFGYKFEDHFFFGMLGAVVVITLNMTFSVSTVPVSLIQAARAMGASRIVIFARVVIPSVIPTLLASARIGFGLAFGGVLLAELYAGSIGMGFLIANYSAIYEAAPLYVIIVIASLIGIASYFTLLGIERRFTRWTRIRR